MSTRRHFTRKFDQVWGIDRYKDSPYYGTVQLEGIHLWNAPAAEAKGDNLTGSLAHGSHVQVMAQRATPDGRTWYKVMADVEYEGKIHRQQGWVVDRMLRDRGKGAFDG